MGPGNWIRRRPGGVDMENYDVILVLIASLGIGSSLIHYAGAKKPAVRVMVRSQRNDAKNEPKG